MRNFAIYSILSAIPAILVINPFVLMLLGEQRGLWLYAALLDLWVGLVCMFAILYLWRKRTVYHWIMVALIVALVPMMLTGEIAYSLIRYKYGDRLLGKIADIHQPDPLLSYTLKPGALDRHTRMGEFDVEYVIDDRGHKAIEQSPVASRTIHVFGDSFAFGFGVSNSDTWLNILSAKLGGEVNILNYGVIGYGLEQMYVSMDRHAEAINRGDLVIFAPIAADLQRGLAARTYVCGNLILGQIQPEGTDTFPKFEGGRWISADLREECNFLLDAVLANTRLRWSLGALYRSLRHRARYDAIMAEADRIFGSAKALAEQRGADFRVVFLPTPFECRNRAFSVDLSGLVTPIFSLIPYCPEDPTAALALSFPYDTHWSPAGHLWAAGALHRLLQDLPY
jgi:hypothetical protein